MPSGDVPIINPWWDSQYGIDSVEEFNTATDPFFDNAYFFDPTGLAKAAAQLSARTFPGSAAGLAAAAYLTRTQYGQTEAGGFMQSLLDAVALAYQQQSGQETNMAQLIIPDCFQVSILGTSGGQVVNNVVGVQNAGGTAAGATAAVQTAWKVASGPMSMLLSQYALTGFRGVDIGDPNGDIAVITDTTAGSIVGSISTNAACALIKWNGGNRSRSSRGRIYHGPIGEGNINADGRTVVAGSITAYNTAYTNFRNSLNSSGYPLVVLSRTLSQAFPVTQHACETVIATQRRRIRG